jgi:hypothetical protein
MAAHQTLNRRDWLIVFLLAISTLAVYWRAATFNFVTIDD